MFLDFPRFSLKVSLFLGGRASLNHSVLGALFRGEPDNHGARASGRRAAVYRRPVPANGAAKSAEPPDAKGDFIGD